MPQGKKFEADKLRETSEALDRVARKPKVSINLKELIKGLKPKIKRLRIWGYTWGEIVELLGQQEIYISEDTLKEYMKTPRKKNKPTRKEASSAVTNHSKNTKQIRSEVVGLSQVNNADTLNKNDASALNEENTDKREDELIRNTEPEVSGYQPIKLTMRK